MENIMNIVLDSFDHAILNALLKDGAQTNAQLSEKVGLSTSQCSRRRARLENDQVILGYQAKVNNQALGRDFRAVTRINLTFHSEDKATAFNAFVAQNREIEAAYSVSGDADYILLIITESLTAFAEFVHTKLLPLPNVAQVRSEIVLVTLKE